MGKVIYHIDLNSFFASAEILLNPSLQGKPIAVAGHSRRGVISTASYEARQYGVNSAMPTAMALKLCPDLILVNGHHSYYEELSQKFINTIKKYSTLVEQASIDECYADMTEAVKQFKKPMDLAWQIQTELLNDFGLKCSIGVAPNKFLAKMASEMKKPMGITVLRIQEVPIKLWPLAIDEMRGVGKKTAPHLHEMGIHTIGDLSNFKEIEKLRMIFGKNTDTVLQRANGFDDSEIICEWDVKTMSQSTTFSNDLTDYDEIKSVFLELSQKLSRRLDYDGKTGNLVSITIKYFDFTSNNRSKKLTEYIHSSEDIFQNALDLFDENVEDIPIRLIGVGISNLKQTNEVQVQINIFEQPQELSKTEQLIKELNRSCSTPSFKTASSIIKKKG
ncbi:MAG: DNA polymerase IV [Anaerorhabdus sp.]|uniref:DNA polymerase IV n=1 Tax=Anaerorhabdus sp. TaxID=1872524 RepID=UPI002FC7AB20